MLDADGQDVPGELPQLLQAAQARDLDVDGVEHLSPTDELTRDPTGLAGVHGLER